MSVTDGIGQTPCSFEHYLVTSTFFSFFTFFQNPKSRDFLHFLPCFVRFLELWCVLEQKLLLTAYIGSMWRIDWYQNEWPWTLFRGCLRSRRPMPHIRHWIWRKMAYADSNGHVTDNVAWSQNVKLVTTIRLEPNISDGLFSTPLPCLTARSGEPVRISGWNLRGKN